METDCDSAREVRRIFDLYAFEAPTLDSLIDELEREGLVDATGEGAESGELALATFDLSQKLKEN